MRVLVPEDTGVLRIIHPPDSEYEHVLRRQIMRVVLGALSGIDADRSVLTIQNTQRLYVALIQIEMVIRVDRLETGLGVVPAQIAPFVVTRVGLTQARRLALLGERFDGAEAVRLGIAHYQCQTTSELDDTLQQVLSKVKRAAPHANRVTKALLHQVGKIEMEQLLDQAAHQFSAAVNSEEGAEGTMAFVQKRLPNWAQ